MQLLIYRDSYEIVRDALAERPDVTSLILEDDGRCVDVAGAPVDDPKPDAAWFSRELILKEHAPTRDLVRIVFQAGTVRWIQSSAAGFEHPVFGRFLEAGIRLSVNDASSIAIAEYVLAEVLACFQPFVARRSAQAAARWERLPFRELHGTRWLIVGYGSIGRAVARRAAAFGASIVGVRRTPQPDPLALRVVGPDALVDEAREADVLVVAAAANASSQRLIDADVLAAMKSDAVLVNVARGALVDEAALLASLDAGRPGAAVLDVFDEEPLPAASPLWRHPRVRLTAHCSGHSDGVALRGAAVFLEHLDAFRAGAPLRLEVTRTD
jgi:phosphoglycerate dehydrogenase-like enzyme